MCSGSRVTTREVHVLPLSLLLLRNTGADNLCLGTVPQHGTAWGCLFAVHPRRRLPPRGILHAMQDREFASALNPFSLHFRLADIGLSDFQVIY